MHMELHELQEHDLRHLLQWRNNPEVNRYLTSRHRTLEEIATWYKQIISDRNALLFGIYCDDALVGYCIVEGVDLASRKCEVGVIIGEPYLWGQGLGKYAVQRLLRHCFEHLKLHRVLAVIARGNARSERLFQRLGFIHEGTLRDATMIDGKFTDLLCYSMLEDEYRQRTSQ
jgi:RimJ/RimL family protein N-acetyltransferase